MIWKRYQNELIVGLTLLLLLTAVAYKNIQTSSRVKIANSIQASVSEFQEIVTLKKRWSDKRTSKKVDKLQTLAPASKVHWQKKGKKLSVNYKGLNAKELNKVVTTILNLAVQIDKLEIVNQNGNYDLELKCKW